MKCFQNKAVIESNQSLHLLSFRSSFSSRAWEPCWSSLTLNIFISYYNEFKAEQRRWRTNRRDVATCRFSFFTLLSLWWEWEELRTWILMVVISNTSSCTFCPSRPGSPEDPCGPGAGVGPGGPGGPLGPGSPRSPFKPCLAWPWKTTRRLQCCSSDLRWPLKWMWLCEQDAPLLIVPRAPPFSEVLQSEWVM